MKPMIWLVWVGLVAVSPLSAQEPKLRDNLKGYAYQVATEAFPQFDLVASLILPDKDRFPGNHVFRSVAIKPPWVYVLDRKRSLYVFQIPEKWQPMQVEATTVVGNVGDGNDLKVVDQVLPSGG